MCTLSYRRGTSPCDCRGSRREGERHYLAYDSAPAWNGGANCADGILPGTRELGDYLERLLLVDWFEHEDLHVGDGQQRGAQQGTRVLPS